VTTILQTPQGSPVSIHPPTIWYLRCNHGHSPWYAIPCQPNWWTAHAVGYKGLSKVWSGRVQLYMYIVPDQMPRCPHDHAVTSLTVMISIYWGFQQASTNDWYSETICIHFIHLQMENLPSMVRLIKHCSAFNLVLFLVRAQPIDKVTPNSPLPTSMHPLQVLTTITLLLTVNVNALGTLKFPGTPIRQGNTTNLYYTESASSPSIISGLLHLHPRSESTSNLLLGLLIRSASARLDAWQSICQPGYRKLCCVVVLPYRDQTDIFLGSDSRGKSTLFTALCIIL
jgi:hypothetical protein